MKKIHLKWVENYYKEIELNKENSEPSQRYVNDE